MEKELDIQVVLKAMREIIGNQAQEIAILKASIEASTTE
jgi:hypothetical protein